MKEWVFVIFLGRGPKGYSSPPPPTLPLKCWRRIPSWHSPGLTTSMQVWCIIPVIWRNTLNPFSGEEGVGGGAQILFTFIGFFLSFSYLSFFPFFSFSSFLSFSFFLPSFFPLSFFRGPRVRGASAPKPPPLDTRLASSILFICVWRKVHGDYRVLQRCSGYLD